MLIRKAQLTDVPGIMHTINSVVPAMLAQGNLQWDATYPNAAVFEQDIALDQLWVAQINGLIAGVAALTTAQEAEYAQVGWDITQPAIVTHRLAVNNAFKGLGVASALLLQADQVALSKGIKILRIDTNTKNMATQKLFPKLGYVFAGEIGLAFRPGLRFYCYQKLLP